MIQLAPVQTFTHYFFKIHINIILPSKFKADKWCRSLSFNNQNAGFIFHLYHPCYMSRQSLSSLFNLPNDISLILQII